MTSFQGDEHWEEVTRLWRAVKRDYFVAVEGSIGLPFDEVRRNQLLRNWEDLCERAPGVARRLARGLRQTDTVFSLTETDGVTFADESSEDVARSRGSAPSFPAHPSEPRETLGTLIDLAARRRDHGDGGLSSSD